MGSPWKTRVVLQLFTLVGESHRERLLFLESRDSLLQHANFPCVDDAGTMLGELHDHGVGALRPI